MRTVFLTALLVAVLPACDFQFSEGGDFECVAGATATGTIDGRAFRADCVEASVSADAVFVGAYQGYGEADEDPAPGQPFSSFRLRVGAATVGTYAIRATGATTLDYLYSPGDDPEDRTTDLRADATSGEVVITRVTDEAVSGTFTFAGPGMRGDFDGPTPTGETVSGSCIFTVPR